MKYILASKSLRRIELLKEIIDDFEVEPARKEEVLDFSFGIEEGMKTLAYNKAREVFDENPNACVIGSDTLVFLGNEPLGKPKDRFHAKQTLESLRGKTHKVYTSVAILSKSIDVVFVDCTSVSFKYFSDDDLEEFLDTNIWEGKSGSYAIQSLDSRYVEKIDGDIQTVIGLPVMKLDHIITMHFK